MFHNIHAISLEKLKELNFKFDNFLKIFKLDFYDAIKITVQRKTIHLNVCGTLIVVSRFGERTVSVKKMGSVIYSIEDINDKSTIFNTMMCSELNSDRINTLDDDSIKLINDITSRVNEIFGNFK